MKRQIRLLSLFVVVALSAGNAFAQSCPTAPTYYSLGGGAQWYDYTPDTSCVVAYGSPTPSASTISCYNEPAWTTGTGWANISYTFSPLSGQVLNSWEAKAYYDFTDPNGSASNVIELWATITHNGSTSYFLLDSHDGTQGDVGCGELLGTFSAAVGDQVTIEVYSEKANSNATIKGGKPHIFSVP